ncbi:hypothetical protein N7537_007560 [Penicillium hordei]|uniref:Uncharacterized protein n=1 Tax=Penicillium hordei TaxID=40994 RepID=A0AAD6DYV6_9EURO|nr:uncharacterized protein N7537_007560 [Penicillium hordei]KAJ5597476.1 hypothetical protein N7537_007560 [Penicillium hordei]
MGKFLCHKSQVPIEDTKFLSPEVRAQQPVPPYQHDEITALKRFKEGGCTVVLELLGYSETVQGKDGLVPGGYITDLIWDKVPGQSSSRELFWSFNKPSKSNINNGALTSFGYLSMIKIPARLIWDQDSCQLLISRFSMAIKVDSTKKWNDDFYAMYQLMNRPKIGWEDIARWEG